MDDSEKYFYSIYWSCWFLVRYLCNCWRNYLPFSQSCIWYSTKSLSNEFNMLYIWFEIVDMELWVFYFFSILKMIKIRTTRIHCHFLKNGTKFFFWHNIDILAVNFNSLPTVVNYYRFLVLSISNKIKTLIKRLVILHSARNSLTKILLSSCYFLPPSWRENRIQQ